MQSLQIFCTVVLVLAATFVSLAKSQNILETFILDKLANYDRWILANHWDPSPITVGPTHITFRGVMASIDCNLSNHMVKDHSRFINVTSVKADLETISVSFAMQEEVTFSGKYTGNGTTWSGNFSGEGDWNITFPEIKFKNMQFNYTISDMGCVSIDTYNLDRLDIPDYYNYEAEVYFQDLWTGEDVEGDEDQIRDVAYGAFRDYLIADSEHPLKKMYLHFLQEIFANTTWADIIVPEVPETPVATTDGETTTPTTTPPTTTTPQNNTNAAGHIQFSKFLAFLTFICATAFY